MHRAMRRIDAYEKLAAIDVALCGNDGLAIKYSEALRENYQNILFSLDFKQEKQVSKLRELNDEERANNNRALFQALAMSKRYRGY